jgi:apolipoprotein N-acyltransferase
MDKVNFKLKLILSVLASISIFLSFPPINIPFFSVLGFAIYFLIISDFKSFKKGLALTFITGFLTGAFLFYWIYYPLYKFYGVNLFLSYLAVIPIAVIYSLYQFVLTFIVLFFIYKITENKFQTLLTAPFIWTFLEVLREFIIFNGFPWNLLGYSISYINIVSQIVSIFGVYFLSIFVLLLAVIMSWILIYYIEKFQIQKFHLITISSVLVLTIALVIFGLFKINTYKDNGIKKRIALIQGNIAQEEKNHVKFHSKINKEYIELINKVKDVDLVILPESSIYIMPSYIDRTYIQFFLSLKQRDFPILAGLDDIVLTDDGDIKVYNSMFLFKTNGEILGYYRKMKLVPIGEYTPEILKGLSKYFSYLGGIDFSFGKNKTIIKYNEFKIVPLICFESIFPYFVGDFAKKGNIIVNITNDAWFGDTSAPYQHFEMARVRAIENGKYMVRVANTGISAVVNPVGEIIKETPLNKREIVYSDIYLIDEKTLFEKYIKFIYTAYLILPLIIIVGLILRKQIEK